MSWMVSSAGDVGARASSASAATLTPARNTARRMNVAAVAVKNNAVITTATAGWVKLAQENSGASFTLAIFVAVAPAANPVFTWTGAAPCAAQCVGFTNLDNPEAAVLAALSFSTGSSNPITSPSIAATSVDSLAVYIAAGAANTAFSEPAGWTEVSDSGSATDAGRFAMGRKAIPALGDLSGATSITGPAAAWVQFQIELVIATPEPGLQIDALNLAAQAEVPSGLAMSALNLIAQAEAPPGLAMSAVNLYALAIPGFYPTGGRRRALFIN